jgi:methionine synthase II (cobalamin-independent)
MTIPTEPVGSLPRPASLQATIEAYDRGEADLAALRAEQDAAARDSIERMEATGSPIVTDGEQRVSSFATYPLADTLAGTGLAEHLAPDGQFFAIFDDGHHRQLPRLTGGPFRYRHFAGEFVEQAVPLATRPLKQAVIAPSMLYLLYPLDGEVEGYPKEAFLADLVDQAEADVRRSFAAGASRVSIDFTEGRLAAKDDPRNPWTGRDLLAEFVDLNNAVLARFSAEERADIGVHTCPGGDMDSVHSAEVDYSLLLPSLFSIDAGYFLVQAASEPDRERLYRLVGEHSRDDADGVPQTVFIGVTNPQDPRVETPDEVADALVAAARHVPVERLGSTDDCGFSPFSIDTKPRHPGPDAARDTAFAKIAARVEGTQRAAERLGL